MKATTIFATIVLLASILPLITAPSQAMDGDGEDINIITPAGSSTVSGIYSVVVDSYAELDGYDWWDYQMIYWVHD